MVVSIVFIIIIAGALAFMVAQWRRGRSGGGGLGGMRSSQMASMRQGVLTVTGVSDRREPDSKGQMYCTVSGTINGPDTAPAEVYGDLVLTTTDPWPQMGSEYPVVYRAGKAQTSWHFGVLPPAPSPDQGTGYQ
ncbi:hypothetical protein GCM10027169_20680 [Gordonia jinhuaensis]|uniref:Uncharacterized protein n=1 Tax=Gordonia jinhuaensis TaxID=1517702 RepID=A0A916TIX0_9ACTN|nr:hypothetical protein [Gordonia jinhuaensis]GGB43738.1 hypothetical protein GCM10011489_34070 [Gordonia jinhuaensis]